MRITCAVLTLATILALADCSQASPSSAGSVAATATRSGPAVAVTSPNGDDVSTFGSTTPSIPAGCQAVIILTSGPTLTIPKDWRDLNALPEVRKMLLVRVWGADPSTPIQRLNSTGVLYGRFSQSGGLSFNSITTAKGAETPSTSSPQMSLDEIIIRQGGMPVGCSTKPSTHGQATVDTSIAQVQGIQTAGAMVAVPTSPDTYVHIAVTASSAEEVDTTVPATLTMIH